MRRFGVYERTPVRESTGSRTYSTRATPRRTSSSSIGGSKKASIRFSHSAECISPKRMGNRCRSRFLPSRVRRPLPRSASSEREQGREPHLGGARRQAPRLDSRIQTEKLFKILQNSSCIGGN